MKLTRHEINAVKGQTALIDSLISCNKVLDPPGKFMSIRGTIWTFLENYKKVAAGKKEHIFENCLGGCFCSLSSV